jgi:hypothetical protein
VIADARTEPIEIFHRAMGVFTAEFPGVAIADSMLRQKP